ncbi:hypothetical protein ABZS61_08785 [Streptomyces sp. NPDC005566]|uniref:hypothetical protein n=1 Tax=Streptomyces sp. NPDC005566 TaxID=3156886 RepID=UPI0033AAB3E4
MSENTPTSTISADYTQRITEDLAANRREQDRARTELTRLQDELIQLEEGEQVLVKMQEVLGGSGKPEVRKGKDTKEASVPAARRSKGKEASVKKGRASKSPAQAAQEVPANGVAASKGSGEPTWRELVTGYLAGQREPRSAAEVAAALTESYPQRKTQVAVVRNTLEQGVASGLLERFKQGRSVYYSPVPESASVSNRDGAGEATP